MIGRGLPALAIRRPQPDGPMITTTSPARTSNETPFTASTSP